MNTEQLKQLKPGDEIFIRARYENTLDDGDVRFSCSVTNERGKLTTDVGYAHSSIVIIPSELQSSPKYDPCRRFKKGDKVRVVERHGRKFWNADPETIYTVVEDEYLHDDQNVLHRGCVGLNDGKPETLSSWNIPFFHLELVTPVEELEPYFVKETTSVYEVFNRNENNSSVAIFFKSQYSIEKAKERAEAECARLNAEQGKEQK